MTEKVLMVWSNFGNEVSTVFTLKILLTIVLVIWLTSLFWRAIEGALLSIGIWSHHWRIRADWAVVSLLFLLWLLLLLPILFLFSSLSSLVDILPVMHLFLSDYYVSSCTCSYCTSLSFSWVCCPSLAYSIFSVLGATEETEGLSLIVMLDKRSKRGPTSTKVNIDPLLLSKE